MLDANRPDIVTLILQSASGGLYRGDRLLLNIAAGEGASAHVTGQAATVVHAAAEGIGVSTGIKAAAGAFLALSTDPYVLFPNTVLSVETNVELGPGATVVAADGFATHDPAGEGRPFGRLSTRCRVRDAAGVVLVDEAGEIEGHHFSNAGSPLGPYRAMGTAMVLGAAALRLRAAALERQLDGLGVLAGATMLPHGAGLCVRLLASGGGPLARGLNAVVAAAFEAAFGRPLPGRRR